MKNWLKSVLYRSNTIHESCMKVPHLLSLGLTLATLWLLLSGHYTGLLLTLGLLSVCLVLYIAYKMDVADREGLPFHIRLSRFVTYWIWLTREIIVSNLDVCYRVLHPKLPISPTVIKIPCSQSEDLGRVIFANSITLTPGTVTLEVDDSGVEVHALCRHGAETLKQGEMDRRVTELEQH